MPGFSADYLAQLISGSDGARLPLAEGQTVDGLTAFLTPILFDPVLYAKKVDQTEGTDMITSSANNFYE